MSVIHLSIKDFTIKSNKAQLISPKVKGTPGILLIFANWCSHCKKFMPTYEKIAASLGKEYPCVAIEEAELRKNNSVSTALDFQGFPTIKFFDQNGVIIGEYSGNRSESDILQHICKVYHHCIMYH